MDSEPMDAATFERLMTHPDAMDSTEHRVREAEARGRLAGLQILAVQHRQGTEYPAQSLPEKLIATPAEEALLDAQFERNVIELHNRVIRRLRGEDV